MTNNGRSSLLSARRLLAKEKSDDRDLMELLELAGVSAPDRSRRLCVDDAPDRVDGRLLDELVALVSRFSSREMAAGRAADGSSASASVISASSFSSASSYSLPASDAGLDFLLA